MLGGLLEPEGGGQTVSFGPKTDFGTGARSRSVAVGDFNGDGTLDLAVTSGVTVSILLGTARDNPFINAAMTFIEPFPVGRVVTLISAVALRKKPPTGATENQPLPA